MKKTLLLIVAAIGVALSTIGTIGIANAAKTAPTPTLTCTAVFRKHPENSTPPWANDTFWRTTTFYKAAAKPNGWTVKISDNGFFWSQKGTTSDSGDKVLNTRYGKFTGNGTYTVTSTKTPACLGLKDYPEGYVYHDGPTTGQWPLHYFGSGTVSLDQWHWDYVSSDKVNGKTKVCEHMSEDSVKGTQGHFTGKVCA